RGEEPPDPTEGDGVCFLGMLEDPRKGRTIAAAVMHALRENNVTVHCLGTEASYMPEMRGSGVVFHGRYEQHRLPQLLHDIHPRLIVLCSQWPETFCYALYEGWSAGYPVCVLQGSGALEEAVKRYGGGFVCPSN